MTVGPLGYGRYADDSRLVACPRARSDMTPCVARDGDLAVEDGGRCVGCDRWPGQLLEELRAYVGAPRSGRQPRSSDALRDLVWEVTRP